MTSNTTNTDLDSHSIIAAHVALARREDLLAACRRAVECLERFAANARREVDRADDLDPGQLVELPGVVLSASAWGAANAVSELSIATRIATDYMKALGALEKPTRASDAK